MKAHNLELAQEKGKTVLITKRRKFEYPKLELDGYTIQFQDSILYLGIWIDRHWNFKDDIQKDIGRSRECRHSASAADAQCGRP